MALHLIPHQELPDLCAVVLQSLWRSDPWQDQRYLHLSAFCRTLLVIVEASPTVVYTSLKYVQNFLATPPNRSLYGSERSIFTVALMLAHKYLENDVSPDPEYWSQASLIPVAELVCLELEFLHRHDLHIDNALFHTWILHCNLLYESYTLLASQIAISSSFSYTAIDTPIENVTCAPSQKTLLLQESFEYVPKLECQDIDSSMPLTPECIQNSYWNIETTLPMIMQPYYYSTDINGCDDDSDDMFESALYSVPPLSWHPTSCDSFVGF
ncbi:hypothetical protein BDF14DRAFT_1767930 [Spinellus fusiger]|nr:hypothetical protein BDF14DRAFT_1767930 [Spinellus fusiger]